MTKKCYMCEKDATSEEHAPPKCLFPDEKDLPNGLNLRKDLIKVPSCESHNSAKSHDDEFLLYILCMNIATNSVALRQFFTKLRRSYKRRPALLHALSDGAPAVIAVNGKGTAFNTALIQADTARINGCFEKIGRAIYFYEKKEKFSGDFRFLYDWIIPKEPNFTVLVKTNNQETRAIDHVKEHFEKLDHKGSNPSVFKYRLEEPDEHGLIALHMQFYEGCNVYLALIPERNR